MCVCVSHLLSGIYIDAASEGGEEVLEVFPAAEEPVGAADHHGKSAHAARDRRGDKVCGGADRHARAVCPSPVHAFIVPLHRFYG